MSTSASELNPVLRRKLGLPLLVLYGTGITIGAGIYVLIGAVAGRAGSYSAWAFVFAAVVMALTVGSYAELATRYPVSAGEAAYVRAAFRSRLMSTGVGLLTFCTGAVAAAAVTLGGAGYIRQFVELPAPLIVVAIILLLGAVAAWGILESVVLAALFTLVEAGGLAWIISCALYAGTPFGLTLGTIPPPDLAVLSNICLGGLLAFFAFVGFEDLANVVEEAKIPHRNIPLAMTITLVLTSILYIMIAAVSVTVVSPRELASSSAPLTLVFKIVTGMSPNAFNLIAVVATLNTVLAQMTMASRVIYGMARQGDLPFHLARVHSRTGTPLVATAAVMLAVAGLALTLPIEKLAEGTSLATLVTFALVNFSLLRIRWRNMHSTARHVQVPVWMPIMGVLTCLLMIASSLLL
jgi:amino acid transporter